MLRVKAITSIFVHRAVGNHCSLFQLRLSARSYHQLHQLPSLGRQAPANLLPVLLHFPCHLPVKRFSSLVGLAAATGFASSFSCCGKIVKCQEVTDDTPSAQEQYTEWDEGNSPLLVWLRRLWVPLLMVMTIAMGWHYPISLGINLFFLLWSTKPTPSSIYIWVEQKRLQAAQRTHGLSRLKAQLSNATMMMHVEVRDYGVACLAQVSSLTQKMVVIGVLGDWWVLYSCSSSISGFNIGSWFPVSPSVQW